MSQKLTQYFAIQFKILNISWRNWYVYSSCKMTLSNVRERLSNAPKHWNLVKAFPVFWWTVQKFLCLNTTVNTLFVDTALIMILTDWEIQNCFPLPFRVLQLELRHGLDTCFICTKNVWGFDVYAFISDISQAYKTLITVLGRYALNKRTEFIIGNLLLKLSLITSCIIYVLLTGLQIWITKRNFDKQVSSLVNT